MFLRIDKLQVELPPPAAPDPNAAAALQELLGGKYGEMSTLNNYLFQSFNFRSKSKLRPFYDLVASITAEELGHVELVTNGVAMLNNGPDSDLDETEGGDISDAPWEMMKDIRLAGAFFSNAGGGTPINSNAQPWNNDFVTTTGNVIVDLLHNFHLECGARLTREVETVTDFGLDTVIERLPAQRVGFGLVDGAQHQGETGGACARRLVDVRLDAAHVEALLHRQ